MASASARLLLVDSDAFVLLSGAGMLEHCTSLLGYSLSNVRRLDALPHMLKKGRLAKALPPEAIASALASCAAIAAVTGAPSEQSSAWVTDAPDIDPGEAFLFAHMLDDPRALLLTGDKRAVVALARTQSLAAVASSVAGRVVCLESALSLLVKELGPNVASAFRPLRPANALLRIAFSDALSSDRDQCLQALDSYYKALDAETGGKLLWNPGRE